eukprot:CAMPEP_0182838416 /NCGR_PEP_ID=MMETSP0006_2-20121128/23294_1 /TAXON_ID=97485 /ORGANISM="Prymnesium parvum, Strain Texoma1" /LENGTH=397 /DNA_ID=CAMNT_0024967443 /DNA_START=37 /DNA_END=1228 /DNA_ORIENTATION=+
MKRAGDPSKAPPAKRQSGFNLDHALSSISQLHAPLSTRGPSAPPLESDETASPYLISKASTATMWPTSSSNSPALAVCRNPQCGRSDFEVDARRGERTCTHCGAVQNTRSLESQEEEHRTFADDDKSESKKRAEVSRDGQGGGAAGPKELQRTMQLANASAERPGELTQKDHERVQKYKKAISELAIALGITEHSAAVDESMHLALTYVESVLAHKQCCKELDKCRLSKTHNAELIAAGLLRMGMIKNSLNRQLAQFAAALNKMGKEATASTVYAACDLVKSHISSFSEDKAYPCSDNKRTILAEGEEDVAAAVTKYTSLLPRICKVTSPFTRGFEWHPRTTMRPVTPRTRDARRRDPIALVGVAAAQPANYVQNRASELIEGWHQQGLPSLQTTTV